MNWEILAKAGSTLIAVAALVFSIISFKKQQDRAEKHARASVKPLLSIKSENYVHLKSIRIVNYGVGPAVIKKAEFRRSDEAVPTDEIVRLFNLKIDWWESFVNVPPNRAVPAEGEIVLVKESLAHLRGQVPDDETALEILREWKDQKTGILVHVEYEDIYGNPMPPLEDVLN